MKKTMLLVLIALLVPSGINVLGTPDTPGAKQNAIRGAWVHRDFYYVFLDSVMTAVKIAGEPKGYKTFKYTVQEMGGIALIRYGRDLEKTADNQFLLIDDITDSTAVFAFPTVFARQDSGSGFIGVWRHARDTKSVLLTVGSGSIDYRDLELDTSTGILTTKAERRGFYQPGKGKYSGRFSVVFDDGTKTTLIPIVFRNVMYLFDVSPRKSVFLRADNAPSFRDYQEAVKH